MPPPDSRRPADGPGSEPAADPGFELADDAATVPPAETPARPARTVVRAAAVPDDDPRPKPMKKKKKRPGRGVRSVETSTTPNLAMFEWIWPSILLGVGLVMVLVGAVGIGGKVGVLHALLVITVGMIASVPLTVVTLIGIGIFAGIEYGRFGPAILKIAAVTFFVDGVWFLGVWAGLPVYLIGLAACAASVCLFMSLFGLDPWEARVSVIGLNLMSFAVQMVLVTFLAAAASKADGGGPADDDPGWKEPPPTGAEKGRNLTPLERREKDRGASR